MENPFPPLENQEVSLNFCSMKTVEKGEFTFVLHSHLPYVISHGEWPHGTDWLYEAAAETYVPLFRELRSVVDKGIQPAVTLGITPILMEQLADERFKKGFKDYLHRKIEAARTDQVYFQEMGLSSQLKLARYWVDSFENILDTFDDLGEDILSGFRKLQNEGVELITCAATHGYLPLLSTDESVSAQVAVGIETFKNHMGRKPRGIWLPECAYHPAYMWTPPTGGEGHMRAGVEEILYEHGLDYFIVDKHLLTGGENRGVYIERFDSLKTLWANFSRGWNPPSEIEDRSVLRPYLVSSTGTERAVAVFGRHEESSLQVWSSEWGYPGNPAYLEFHKKHFPGGHKYWRVTGRETSLGNKGIYHPEWIESALEEQANHFVDLISKDLEAYRNETGEPGLITAPFDSELFGHWWWEGIRWLGKVLRKLPEKGISPTTCGHYLDNHLPRETISLPEGSWGKGGFHFIWLNEWTEWTWEEIYHREKRYRELADRHGDEDDRLVQSILKQMGRELLLLQSSDWQFLISTWSARDYAEDRIQVHIQRFDELDTILRVYMKDKQISDYSMDRLSHLEKEDAIFGEIKPNYWKSRKSGTDL